MASPVPPASSGEALAADAWAQIRSLIIRGRLAPAARVTEAELATRFGISRTPAREAMRRLLAEGLLVPAGGGARPRLAVAPVGPEDARELYAAAGALEGVAMRGIPALSAKERRSLLRLLREREASFRAAARARPIDFDQLFERHNAFHEALMDACAGPAIRALLETVRPRLDRYEWLYAPLVGPDFSATFTEHSAIITAVRSGSGRACERAVRANWFGGGKRMARALAEAGDLGLGRTMALAAASRPR